LSLLLLLQADKLLASRWLPLAGYGYYMLAATVANGLGVLSAPVFNTLLPRLAALAASGDRGVLAAEYRRGTRLIALFVLPAMINGVVLAEDLIRLWTRDATTARFAAGPASLLLVGMGFASVLQLAMALQLATGRTSTGARINALFALAVFPLGLVGSRYGAIGVAGAWASLAVLAALGGGAAVYREQLGTGAGRWLLVDIGRPIAAMLAVTLIAWPVLQAPVSLPFAALRLLAFGVTLMAVSALASGFRRSSLTGTLGPATRPT
jgi:O-antigen/teichoic acid export membrane protein